MMARIEERQIAFMERQTEDKAEAKERWQKDQEERKIWRDSIEKTVTDLDKKIAPVVRDHQIIVVGGKWIAATIASGFGTVKAWVFIKDHLK